MCHFFQTGLTALLLIKSFLQVDVSGWNVNRQFAQGATIYIQRNYICCHKMRWLTASSLDLNVRRLVKNRPHISCVSKRNIISCSLFAAYVSIPPRSPELLSPTDRYKMSHCKKQHNDNSFFSSHPVIIQTKTATHCCHSTTVPVDLSAPSLFCERSTNQLFRLCDEILLLAYQRFKHPMIFYLSLADRIQMARDLPILRDILRKTPVNSLISQNEIFH